MGSQTLSGRLRCFARMAHRAQAAGTWDRLRAPHVLLRVAVSVYLCVSVSVSHSPIRCCVWQSTQTEVHPAQPAQPAWRRRRAHRAALHTVYRALPCTHLMTASCNQSIQHPTTTPHRLTYRARPLDRQPAKPSPPSPSTLRLLPRPSFYNTRPRDDACFLSLSLPTASISTFSIHPSSDC